jgi:hypothetical protein
VTGLGLTSLEDVLGVADDIGLDADTVKQGVTADEVKHQLTEAIDAAITAGAVGVPPCWGQDNASGAMTASRPPPQRSASTSDKRSSFPAACNVA